MKTLIGYRVIKLWFLQLPAILFLLLETYKHISKFYISQSNWAFEKKKFTFVSKSSWNFKISYLLRL